VVLERCNARVVTAASADEALRVLERIRPDIVLCDIGMPGKDGYGFIRDVRHRDDSTPALAVTAFAHKEDRIRALRAGYQGQIAKPVEPAELISTVAAFVRMARDGGAAAARKRNA
jgi:DNA-binding response OmpR family regulator